MAEDAYWSQGLRKIEEYVERVNEIIGGFPSELRADVQGMMAGPVGQQFMTAPASTRKEFHYAFPAGLVAHSLRVVDNARKISGVLAPKRWPAWKVDFCALFHDLGKAGNVGNPYYLKVEEDWKFRRGEHYEVNKDEWMPSSEKGIYILQDHGIPIDHETYCAIRLNDGAGARENAAYSFREPPLALIIHWADHWSMVEEKQELLDSQR